MRLHLPHWGELSLRSRILAALTAVLIPAIVLPVIHVYGTRDDLRRNILLFQAEKLVRGISTATLDRLPLTAKNGENLYYTLYTEDGKLLWHSPIRIVRASSDRTCCMSTNVSAAGILPMRAGKSAYP